MKKFGIPIAVALTAAAGPALADPVPTVTFSNGYGPFIASGNVGIATGATYAQCCGTSSGYTNPFVAFGGGDMPSGSLTTTFNTLIGSTYTVSFDYSALGGGSEPLYVTVGSQTNVYNPVANANLPSAFTHTSFTFTGTGAPTSLSIQSGGYNGVDAIIDNVGVAGAVPEPATWAMMVLGFGMVGFGLRSRRKVATKVSSA